MSERFSHHIAVKDAARRRKFEHAVAWWTVMRYENAMPLESLMIWAGNGNYRDHQLYGWRTV